MKKNIKYGLGLCIFALWVAIATILLIESKESDEPATDSKKEEQTVEDVEIPQFNSNEEEQKWIQEMIKGETPVIEDDNVQNIDESMSGAVNFED